MSKISTRQILTKEDIKTILVKRGLTHKLWDFFDDTEMEKVVIEINLTSQNARRAYLLENAYAPSVIAKFDCYGYKNFYTKIIAERSGNIWGWYEYRRV